VVDDDREILRMIELTLRSDFQVVTALDGEKALRTSGSRNSTLFWPIR